MPHYLTSSVDARGRVANLADYRKLTRGVPRGSRFLPLSRGAADPYSLAFRSHPLRSFLEALRSYFTTPAAPAAARHPQPQALSLPAFGRERKRKRERQVARINGTPSSPRGSRGEPEGEGNMPIPPGNVGFQES